MVEKQLWPVRANKSLLRQVLDFQWKCYISSDRDVVVSKMQNLGVLTTNSNGPGLLLLLTLSCLSPFLWPLYGENGYARPQACYCYAEGKYVCLVEKSHSVALFQWAFHQLTATERRSLETAQEGMLLLVKCGKRLTWHIYPNTPWKGTTTIGRDRAQATFVPRACFRCYHMILKDPSLVGSYLQVWWDSLGRLKVNTGYLERSKQ